MPRTCCPRPWSAVRWKARRRRSMSRWATASRTPRRFSNCSCRASTNWWGRTRSTDAADPASDASRHAVPWYPWSIDRVPSGCPSTPSMVRSGDLIRGSRRTGSRARAPRDGRSPIRYPLREKVAPARITPRDLRDGGFTRRAPVAPADERVPEGRPAHGEPDEAGDPGGRRQPGLDLRRVLTPSEDDAADPGAAGASCRRDHGRAVLGAIEAFDLPDVGLDPRILERVDRVDHVARPARPVVRALV